MEDLPKGVQMAIRSTIAMLLPKDVVAKLEPLVIEVQDAIKDFRETLTSLREGQEAIRQTQEHIQDELASINARLDSAAPVDGKPERSRKRGSHNASEPGTGSDATS